ncbi:nicotinate-nucleotide adenylyltransferase [Paenibacillus sp. N1-5-1-14]|uniref:nicotinate-nucleotide adenylyltransferase n=1 Tax=Paenibacillus radicibacter TaxID=2972488 RepID=UPI002158B33A|nr:nicotinate-nucleotide adenylyltransferase [Paenibacillus radicibacter]MCR8645733.1 nicotinate-nucleotide adenylyltransferase [Paenibacillus radicibacter]
MRIGIMGGTFDPIHIGHLIAAERARVDGGLDEVWFMPTFVPPHKERAPLGSPEQRLEMVRLATEENPHFKACDFELRKGGVSYSIYTVEQLTAAHPAYSFYYIIGGDMVQYLPKWFEIDRLVTKVKFLGLDRGGYVIDHDQLPAQISSVVTMVEMPNIELSSTFIRSKVHAGDSIRYLVTESVNTYIKECGLYES